MEALFDAPELLILVFQSCDGVEDGLSLASTCQFLASIWRTHTAVILHRLIEAEMPGFNQALIAVRTTNLVFAAYEANQLPPRPPPLHTLGARFRKPDIPELKRLLGLRHLARCVEHMYRQGTRPDQMHESEPATWLSAAARARMSERFQRAVYRVLVAGAVLTREYMEPLFRAGEGPEGLLRRLAALDAKHEEEDWDEEIAPGDRGFLERFPAYDLEAGRERWEGPFGELGRWLREDIEKTFVWVRPPRGLKLGMDGDQLGRLQEVTFFLAAYEHVLDKLVYKFLPTPGEVVDPDMPPPLPPPLMEDARKVPVAMFGLFRPEVVWMPRRVEDSAECYLVNKSLVLEDGGARAAGRGGNGGDCAGVSPWAVDVPWVLEILHMRSGQPNLRDGSPSPPPALRFVEFVLAVFFKVRFKTRWLFDQESAYSYQDYTIGFLQSLDLFGDRSIMCGKWLFDEDKAPTLSYRRLY